VPVIFTFGIDFIFSVDFFAVLGCFERGSVPPTSSLGVINLTLNGFVSDPTAAFLAARVLAATRAVVLALLAAFLAFLSSKKYFLKRFKEFLKCQPIHQVCIQS
jgi:hypothetical protein